MYFELKLMIGTENFYYPYIFGWLVIELHKEKKEKTDFSNFFFLVPGVREIVVRKKTILELKWAVLALIDFAVLINCNKWSLPKHRFQEDI